MITVSGITVIAAIITGLGLSGPLAATPDLVGNPAHAVAGVHGVSAGSGLDGGLGSLGLVVSGSLSTEALGAPLGVGDSGGVSGNSGSVTAVITGITAIVGTESVVTVDGLGLGLSGPLAAASEAGGGKSGGTGGRPGVLSGITVISGSSVITVTVVITGLGGSHGGKSGQLKKMEVIEAVLSYLFSCGLTKRNFMMIFF